MRNLRALFLLFSTFAVVLCHAQPAANYYSATVLNGKNGRTLELALSGIIFPHEHVSYDDHWTAYEVTDPGPIDSIPAFYKGGKTDLVYDMYAWMGQYPKFYSDKDHSQTGGFNREHCVPNSWWGAKAGNADAYCDLHHLVPSDGAANNAKANYPLGEYESGMSLVWPNATKKPSTASETLHSQDGTYVIKDTHVHTPGESCSANASHLWRVSNSANYGGATNVFEPADQYKGDFARMYLYIVCCYEGKLNWLSEWQFMFENDANNYTVIKDWALRLLLKWHRQDPVSDKERARNNAVESIQKNRNPFIDYPELVEYIWGDKSTSSFSLSKAVSAYSDEYKNNNPGGNTGGDNTGGDDNTGEGGDNTGDDDFDTIGPELTPEIMGISGSTYQEYSNITGASGTKYYAYCSNGTAIQLRSSNNNSGIVSTTTRGSITKISVEWNVSTVEGRVLNVYGKNTPYTNSIELYSEANQGVLLGTITSGTNSELVFDTPYPYVGIRSNSGALYLNSVTLSWKSDDNPNDNPGDNSDDNPGDNSDDNPGDNPDDSGDNPTEGVPAEAEPEYRDVECESTVFFYESFDTNNFLGGNDGSWSGTIASGTLSADNEGWDFTKGSGASCCAKFGTGKAAGIAVTPALGKTDLPEKLVLKFRAGAWLKDETKLNVTVDNGALSANSVTLVCGEFNDYKLELTGAKASTRITFSSASTSSNRFFLDEVSIESVSDDGGSGTRRVLVGDVNKDEKVTVSDLASLIVYLLDNGQDCDSEAADIDDDGDVDDADALLLMNKLLRKK